MTTIQLKVKLLNDFPTPKYATEDSNGLDLLANIIEPVEITKNKRVKIPLGIKIALPKGYGAFVIPRSGLAAKYGITITNTPGLIDNDYRGELCAIVENLNDAGFIVEPGMRIAQMVVVALPQVTIIETEELDETVRGEGGFGSTGV